MVDIRAGLRAGVMLPEGKREATTQGVPQGGPLSPLLANIMLDPLDKELEKRGHRFARYADDFLILVKSARAARRVMASVTRFVEVRLGLVVNRQKSQAAPLRRCTFLGFAIKRGKVVWTDKAYQRFKERIKEITSRSWGVSMPRRLDELRRYAVGWLNYFGISHTYRELLALDQRLRRRVRLCSPRLAHHLNRLYCLPPACRPTNAHQRQPLHWRWWLSPLQWRTVAGCLVSHQSRRCIRVCRGQSVCDG